MPVLDQVNLVATDMEATLAFYRALGLDIPDTAIWRTASGAHHVDLEMPGGFELAFDSAAMAQAYNAGWKPAAGGGARSVLSFRVASRDEVDRTHAKLTALGHASAQAPFDTFWGSRYAILEDPDGNHVGLMSQPDPSQRRPPPDL